MNMDESLYEKIKSKCEEADNLYDDSLFFDACKKYQEALAIIPEPKEEWEASTWVYTALGDTWSEIGNVNNALQAFMSAEKCPDGTTNPYIQLRIGMCFLDLNNTMLAKEYLIRAYMLDGEEIFDDTDPKYFNLIKPFV